MLGVGVVCGYLAARLRDCRTVRKALEWLGLRYQPEATVIERALAILPIGAKVTVTFKDGRSVSGFPIEGHGLVPEGQTRELLLSDARWWSKSNKRWADSQSRAVLVNLDQMRSITLNLPSASPSADAATATTSTGN